MKVNLRVLLSFLVFVAAKSEFANGTPIGLADKPNNGSSTELTTGETASNPKEPPLIFPKDSSVYKIVENDTALKILQARAAVEKPKDGKSSATDEGQNVQRQPLASVGGTVSNDESIKATGSSSNNKNNGNNATLSSSNSNDGEKKDTDDDYNSSEEDEDKPDSQEDDTDYDAEELQPEDPVLEDGLEEQFGNKQIHYPLIIDNATIEVSAMRQEHIWIIMVGAIIVLALAAYIAMVLYRNRLEQRYGMRQRLVTEDDYYSNNEI
ncbi:probable serine/threonine-protein kinase mps1 isoform X2 [Ochlerotatus camptorhynchus]|uniref:probable serine/threonine-protein kinase mps1 isoform X2 n=1 Tax=Ochlerotatus camptorhynchus TaxID=644619 RepID=UPI0031CE64E6